jgi:hypothetical protein
MNAPARTYSSFTALLIFFAAVTVMDLDQTVTLHRRKLALMQEYAQAITLQKQVDARTKWIGSVQHELLSLAPGDPEAEAIVSDLNLRPGQTQNR